MAPRILIADDDDQLAASLEALLHRHGIDSERTSDGVDTLTRIVASAPDVLLLDLHLPRLSGIDLLGKLRKSPRTCRLPVIVGVSPHKKEIEVPAANALGAAACLDKPYRPEALLSALRHALETKKPASMDRHLLRAFTSRFTGRWILKGKEDERSLLFVDGSPVSLHPGFLHRDFGDYLQVKGSLSAEEYAYYAGEGGRRHESLVRMGCMEYPDLLQEMLSWLTDELVESFGHSCLLTEETPFPLPPALQVVTVNLPGIFHHGYRRHPRPTAARQLLAHHGGRYVALSGEYFRHINFLRLDAEEKQLLPLLDGSRTLSGCFDGRDGLLPLLRTFISLRMLRFAAAPLESASTEGFPLRLLFNTLEEEPVCEGDETMESFADLVATEEEEFTSPPPGQQAPDGGEEGLGSLREEIRRTHADLKGKDHYGVFAMTPGKFSIGLLKERYFEFTRRYGPEVLMQLTGEEAAMVEEILGSVTAAYDTLSNVVKKERYDEMLGSDKVGLGQKGDDKFQAQVQFQSGKVFIEMGEWDSAEKALQDACNIDPNSGAFLAHLAWAVHRNPENARSRAMQDKAKQMINRALTLERTAQGFAFKGWMLLEGGQDALAELEFNKALKLDARILPARQGLRAIQDKREQEKKGLFRKMFR